MEVFNTSMEIGFKQLTHMFILNVLICIKDGLRLMLSPFKKQKFGLKI